MQMARGDLEYRSGSDIDRDLLSETFRMLNFNVKVFENLNCQQLFSTIVDISRYDYTPHDALVICILSHGDRNCIYTTDSIPIKLDVIKTHFNGLQCPTLLNKPKMFFMQACQGDQNQSKVTFPISSVVPVLYLIFS